MCAVVAATPAAANPFKDCFERIAVAVGHAPVRHHRHLAVRAVRHLGPVSAVHHRRSTDLGPAHALQTRYIVRPIACGTREAAPLSRLAGFETPSRPDILVPPRAIAAPGVDVAEVRAPLSAPTPPPAPATGDALSSGGFFGAQGFSGGGLPGGGVGVFTPPRVLPVQPGVTPPLILPPVTPPEGPPVVPIAPTPPGVIPVAPPTPPAIPPFVEGPPPSQPPGGSGHPPGGVPEPSTWTMLIGGVFALGARLRHRARIAALKT